MILIIGDTHGTKDNFDNVALSYPNLTKNDYVIVTGDFGFVWGVNEYHIKDDDKWLDFLEEKPWTTLFVDGNHENHIRLNQYPIKEWRGGRVHKIRESVFHLMRGEVFEIEGKTFFCFGGAESTDKQYRLPYQSWWPQEIPSQEEYNNAISNLEKINYRSNYIVTHAMPDIYVRELYGSQYVGGDKTAYMLNDFLLQCIYDKWYCGHYHLDAKMRDNFQICYKQIYEIK